MTLSSSSISGRCLWTPSPDRTGQAHCEQFRHFVAQRHAIELTDFNALHRWSVSNREAFWLAVWDYTGIRASQRGSAVLENGAAMPGARWFPQAKLNFAENLLRRTDDAPAIVFQGEAGDIQSMSYAMLYRQVRAVAKELCASGVVAGDRVAGFLPNIPQAVVAMLASSSIGAVWSSCSPDFGVNGVRDRFGQIEPKVLFTADAYRYAGKVHDSLGIVSELVDSLDSLVCVVVIEYVGAVPGRPSSALVGRAAELKVAFSDWLQADADFAEELQASPIDFAQLPFDHPLYILYSSGTTGKPKCIVHGAGGTLLQHVKEHQLHVDLKPDDRIFFFTTCGWMMWNWLVSALSSEATLLLYDGSPFFPDGNTLFDFAESSGMTHLGTSAKFIDACNKASMSPKSTHQLHTLKSVLSTGSPLLPESFDYVYEHIAADICLSSMSGGTDIVSCFALGNSAAPVYRGELQCLGLGMDVQVFDDAGKPVACGTKGELVCVQPFPSMPTGFFGDGDGSRYRAAYFEKFPGVWCHGDYVAITEHHGLVIFGRSDSVLNPGGVRIGTAEIYRQVESFEEIVESLVIGQRWQSDVRIVLFVRMLEGLVLDDELRTRLCTHIRKQTTPRHVPAHIIQVSDIPRTRSGKIVELAVHKVVHGESVNNLEALANPEALALFESLPDLNI